MSDKPKGGGLLGWLLKPKNTTGPPKKSGPPPPRKPPKSKPLGNGR